MAEKEMGTLLVKLRKERNMTQKEVAERLSISPQAVSKWERNNGYPDVSLLPAISNLFGVAVNRLLAGDLNPEIKDGGTMKRVKFYVCPDCATF